jgi:HSP20 family molecular chaperone IbpA
MQRGRPACYHPAVSEMDPTETWMWERARDLLEQADRIQRSFFAPQRPGTRRPSWEPPVDVFETPDGSVWVLVALPGVEPTSVCVELAQEVLRVAGERLLPPSFRSAVVHRLEIPNGRFERRVGLPPGPYRITEQRLVDGCLHLCLTRTER